MTVYVALLRAVNVGGTGALPMTELKAICEALGLEDVRTYIQSGNILFRSDEPEDAVAERLDTALGKKFGKRPGVMVRTTEELEAIAGNAPFLPQPQYGAQARRTGTGDGIAAEKSAPATDHGREAPGQTT